MVDELIGHLNAVKLKLLSQMAESKDGLSGEEKGLGMDRFHYFSIKLILFRSMGQPSFNPAWATPRHLSIQFIFISSSIFLLASVAI
jgi:hypothetical protein